MRTYIKYSVNEFLRLRYECSQIHMLCCRWSQQPEIDVDRYLSISARLSWSLGRTLTGWLRGQPDWRLHPRSPLARHAALRLVCYVISWRYRSTEARRRWLAQRLHRLSLDLRDIRAISSSREINSVIGRYELLLQSALEHSGRLQETSTRPAIELEPALMRQRTDLEPRIYWAGTADWPYLAV